MSVEGTINGWPTRVGLRYLRCRVCGRSIKISEEEQNQFLDRKIVNEAEERMAMLLEARRL
jgi:hypothetical protein